MFSPVVRPFSRSKFLPSLVGAGALVLVIGCQVTSPPRAATSVAAPAAIRTVNWDATEYAFNTPETLPAGPITIRLTNQGHEPHHAQLLRLNDGVSFEQFGSALQAQGEAALAMTSLEGGPGTIDPLGISQVTLDLKPGSYAVACFFAGPDGVPHLAKGMLKPLQVTPADVPLNLAPVARRTFTLKDFSFDMPDVLPAGSETYKVVNVGSQPHELSVLKLTPGTTAQDVLSWDQAPAGPPPFASVGGINAFSTDGSGYFTLDLEPGTYVAVCHVPDSSTGIAHLHLGMIKQFVVPG
ncbi:MAG TPA: hypothetical protein VGQ62_06230 [Chloroflexota bacterium]|jgi:hypothetical protein|nr:hypothetical protein [Chloroflexota bacterium]